MIALGWSFLGASAVAAVLIIVGFVHDVFGR